LEEKEKWDSDFAKRKKIKAILDHFHSEFSVRIGGSTSVYYAIDARGTDPVLTEQRTKAAILAAHNSAVGTSVQAHAEQMKRMPQR